MKKTLVFIIIIILALGLWWFFTEDVEEELDLENDEEVLMEEEEDNVYQQVEEVTPVSQQNEVMDEDFRFVLSEIFEEEPKLVESEEITVLSYVVNRTITPEDVIDVRDLLETEGYETVATTSGEIEHELDISITEEVLEERYDGDIGGNMYVRFWIAEEGEDAQRIEVVLL